MEQKKIWTTFFLGEIVFQEKNFLGFKFTMSMNCNVVQLVEYVDNIGLLFGNIEKSSIHGVLQQWTIGRLLCCWVCLLNIVKIAVITVEIIKIKSCLISLICLICLSPISNLQQNSKFLSLNVRETNFFAPSFLQLT